MRKQILLPPSVFRELYQNFQGSQGDSQSSAKVRTQQQNAIQMLRAAALERGGLIYTGERATARLLSECRNTPRPRGGE